MDMKELTQFLNKWAEMKAYRYFDDIKVTGVDCDGEVTLLRDAPLIACMLGETITWVDNPTADYVEARFTYCGTVFKSYVSKEEMIAVLSARLEEEE